MLEEDEKQGNFPEKGSDPHLKFNSATHSTTEERSRFLQTGGESNAPPGESK